MKGFWLTPDDKCKLKPQGRLIRKNWKMMKPISICLILLLK